MTASPPPSPFKKTAIFTGTTYASRYAYDDKLKRCNEIIRHQKGAVRIIKYIFPEPVFLDLFDNKGQMVRKTLQKIIKHLKGKIL